MRSKTIPGPGQYPMPPLELSRGGRFSTAKPKGELDWVIVRENSEGEYSGHGGRAHRGMPEEVGTEVAMTTAMTPSDSSALFDRFSDVSNAAAVVVSHHAKALAWRRGSVSLPERSSA